MLTDALRAAILRLVGYRVEVIEFVDSRHTPRNALIRAVRTGRGAGRHDGAHIASCLASGTCSPRSRDGSRRRIPIVVVPMTR